MSQAPPGDGCAAWVRRMLLAVVAAVCLGQGALAFGGQPSPRSMAVPASSAPLSRRTREALIEVLKRHRCDDGHTVSEVFRYARRLGFKIVRYGVSRGADGQIYATVDYTLGSDKQSGDAIRMAWLVSANRHSVSPREGKDESIVQLGAFPFVYYLNNGLYRWMYGAPHSQSLLKDKRILSILPAHHFRDGVEGVFWRHHVLLKDAQILPIPADMPDAGLHKGDIVMDVYFVLPGKASKGTGATQHARWVKPSGSRAFKPWDAWARRLSADNASPPKGARLAAGPRVPRPVRHK
ncbi:MAG: hypothetical protein M0T84_15765 [Betaproteobacteria bacterium]|nr:hypothetical protein [Betaproteobacteria bacterium]